VSGFEVPGESETNLVQAAIAIPGSLLGLGAAYAYGARTDPSA
jgi:hypothetical protein